MAGTAMASTVFDQRHYLELIRTRGEAICAILTQLTRNFGLQTALDVGCGVGFFSEILRQCGLTVAGIDGREVNVAEARQRYPDLRFSTVDIEDSAAIALGPSDLVLCFGLLYHLESPLRAIRHLRALTGKVLLLESMCIPGSTDHALLRAEPKADDQSLTNLAFYASEQCIADMLYGVGFHAVYRFSRLPDHDDFRETVLHHRRRTILCASFGPLQIPGLEHLQPTQPNSDPWQKKTAQYARLLARGRAFAARPPEEKYWALKRRVLGLRFGNSNILRLPFGCYWLLQSSGLDHDLNTNSFEQPERVFVEKLLQPGMTVVDAGAHHGLYTLLASRKVGRTGKVLAIEPSPRERLRLEKHVRVNRCRNVTLYPLALGSAKATADLFLVDESQDYCNSLRPPAIAAQSKTVSVPVRPLDQLLADSKISRVDFLKLDIEGGELEALRGARNLLSRQRPLAMIEVQDIRTQPWGYAASEIIDFMHQCGYGWYQLTAQGALSRLDTSVAKYDGNFVAWPCERAVDPQFLTTV